MEFKLLPLLAFLSVAVVASHAALPSEVYWKLKLPNTPMPKSLKDLLQPDWTEDKSTSVNVGHQGVGVATGTQKSGTNVGVGKGGVIVRTGPKRRPVYVGVTPGPNPFVYLYAATQDQLKDNPNVALFFLEKDLQKNTKMNLHFFKSSNPPMLLPRHVADSIPFSSSKIPEILGRFSLDPASEEAQVIKQTIKECEEPGIMGEEKYCATSLESMVDFTTSKLGNNVKAVSTLVERENPQLQKYTITNVKLLTNDEESKSVICHEQNYAYGVFYCHKTDKSKAYVVSLAGEDGTKVEAAVVCHKDTSAWNPKHLAFQVLKVKPGTVPVCHFLPEDHIVWVPNY